MTPHRRARSDARLRDRGTSLVEILVSVVLLGSAGIAVLVGLATAVVGARVTDEVATSQVWLASTGDRLMSSANNESVYQATDTEVPGYVSCSTAGTSEILVEYQSQVDAIVDGADDAPDITVTGVEFWDGSGFGPTCHVSSGHRLQRVSLEASVDGEYLADLTVLRRPYTADDGPASALSEPDSNHDGIPDPIVITENPYVHGPTTTTTTTTNPPGPTTTIAGPVGTTTTTIGTGTTTTTSPPSTSTTVPPASTTTTTVAAGVSCSATVAGKWNSGYQIDVTVTNYGPGSTNGWTATLTYPDNAKVTSSWNVSVSTDGNVVVARSLSWNGNLSAGSSATFGLQGPKNDLLPDVGNPVPCSARNG